MTWKDIEDYEGYYQINEYGNIKNVKTNKIRTGRINSSHGYVDIDLYKDGVCSWKRVHRLVAEAFIPNPNKLPVVMHLDNNKTNNYYLNLKWGTISENTKQAFDDGLEDTRCLYEIYKNNKVLKIVGQQKLMEITKYSQSMIGIYLKTEEPFKKGPFKGYKIKKIGRTKKIVEL